MLLGTNPVMVVAAPPPPAVPRAASFQLPDLTPAMARAEEPQEPKMLPRTIPVMVVAAPPSRAVPMAASIELPDLAPAMAPTEALVQTQLTPGMVPALTVAMAPPMARQAVLSQPSIDPGPDIAPLERLAELSLQKSQPAVHSPRAPVQQRRHLAVVNATGRSGISKPVRQHLLHLGWTVPLWAAAAAGRQSDTTIRFGESHSMTAHALARTLPFRVHLAMCADCCNGLEFIVGSNYLGWKPRPSLARRWG
jgi:hypothetical protein